MPADTQHAARSRYPPASDVLDGGWGGGGQARRKTQQLAVAAEARRESAQRLVVVEGKPPNGPQILGRAQTQVGTCARPASATSPQQAEWDRAVADPTRRLDSSGHGRVLADDRVVRDLASSTSATTRGPPARDCEAARTGSGSTRGSAGRGGRLQQQPDRRAEPPSRRSTVPSGSPTARRRGGPRPLRSPQREVSRPSPGPRPLVALPPPPPQAAIAACHASRRGSSPQPCGLGLPLHKGLCRGPVPAGAS